MIRYLLLFLLALLVYYSLKKLLRAAFRSLGERTQPRPRAVGRDMALDPECNTYVAKSRAVERRIRGESAYFCSESCARKHEEKDRS